MAPYPQNTFYDPVGSQPAQPSGYTYANTNSQYPSQNNNTYQSNYTQNYGSNYDNQYASSNQQQSSSSSANAAAAGLNSLSTQNYSQPASSSTSRSNVAYDTSNSTWGTQNNYAATAYNSSTSRTQANQSPIYATQSSGSTFGRLSLPDQTQSSSNTYAGTQNYPNDTSTTTAQSSSSGSGSRGYGKSPNRGGYKNKHQPPQQQTQQPPQRYASPLHAMQAQQQQQQQSGHNKQPSRSSNQTQPSPQVAARNLQQHRQQSASVEPMTVDPSQVYDIRAEREKQARIDAEKRRKYEAEQAAKKAEEDAKQAEEDARKAEEERIAHEARKAKDDARKAREAEAKKKATAERKKEARRKAKEEKQSNTAATALQQLSSGGGGGGSSMDMMAAMMGNMSGPPANDEEAEMRAMFKKMREFNQKNPAMLAKLWEEERKQHAAQSSPGPAQPAQPAQTAVAPQPPAPKLTKKQQKAAATAAASAAPAQPTTPAFNHTALALPTKPTPAPATPQGSAALWPPHKKGSLAEAAAKWLSALPENRNSGKTIDREQVLKILDTNPSYVQLCEAVEKTGVRFERSALAKELLKAVPDGLRGGQSGVKAGASTAPNVTEANGTPASAPPKKKGRPKKDEPGRYSQPGGRGSGSGGTVSYSAPKFNSLTDAAREVNSMTTTGGMFPSTVSSSISNAYIPATQDPTFYTPPIVVNDAPPPSASQPPEVKPEEKPSEPPPPPKDKEEAARKRGFGDLVDLTAGDSDDDEGPPRKVFVPPAGPANGIVKPVPSSDGFRQPMSYQQFIQQNKAQPARPPAASGFGFGQPGPSYSASRPPPFGPQQIWNGPKMQPAAPTPPPLQPQNRPKGPTEEQKQAERIQGKMLVEPSMRDRVARKSKYDSRTIARDVLLATGRHPDMRALNGHLNIMQKMLGDHGGVIDGAGNKSDLSTIRWDLIDPGEPTEDAKSKAKSASNREEDDIEDADNEDDSTFHARQRSSSAGLTGKVPNPNFERKKKASVGRPRKSLNADRDSSLRDASSAEEHPELTSDLSPHISRATPTSRRGSTASNYTPKTGDSRRTASSMSKAAPPPTAGTPTGYAALRPVDENGNPIKKKGRPVGWRKNIHSREAQGLTPKKSGVYEPKTSSKLRQSTAARESSEVVEPHYQVFPCKWRDCDAELDNLEKLKKHTLKIHGDANGDGDFECRWRDCGNGVHIDAVGNERTGDAGVTSFETLDHWFKHVNKAHIQPIAWKLGDGPRGGSVHETRNDSAAYLSDASGRSVTPIVLTPQEFAKQRADAEAGAEMEDVKPIPTCIGTMPPPTIKRKPGRPPKTQEPFGLQSLSLDKTEREAAAELKKLEDQKRHEGVTMGLEGSRLVNEKRRRGFLDDEDFADFIQESNEPGF